MLRAAAEYRATIAESFWKNLHGIIQPGDNLAQDNLSGTH
jgi:hypothetical protein